MYCIKGELVSNVHTGRKNGKVTSSFKLAPDVFGDTLQIFCHGPLAERASGRKKGETCMVLGVLRDGGACANAKNIIWEDDRRQ